MKNICTILVNSCDKYEEAWKPFFFFLKKEWPDCPFPLAINTESKQYNDPNTPVISLNSDNKSWGGRLYDALRRIETPYVICMLEDFFIRRPVDKDEIYRCIDRMNQNTNIAAFYFNRIGGFTVPSEKYQSYNLMIPYNSNPQYFFNCQAGIWRKSALEAAVMNCKTPWDFETIGFQIAPDAVKNMEFYCMKESCHDKIRESDVFSYILQRSEGYGIWGGKWLWNNKKWFKENDVNCECKTLPVMTKFDYKYMIFKEKFKNQLYRIYSLMKR